MKANNIITRDHKLILSLVTNDWQTTSRIADKFYQANGPYSLMVSWDEYKRSIGDKLVDLQIEGIVQQRHNDHCDQEWRLYPINENNI